MKRTLVHPAHEVVKVLAPRRYSQALVELVHQPGFTPPHRPPQVHAANGRAAFMQRFVAFLQRPHGMLLGLVLDEALLLDRVLPGA
ncbi:hypothetical protein D9M72_554270 [compost metagenome]